VWNVMVTKWIVITVGRNVTDSSRKVSISLVGVDADPQTPVEQICPPQVDDSGAFSRPWLLIGRKINPRSYYEDGLLKY
jgi:hypothetical protein